MLPGRLRRPFLVLGLLCVAVAQVTTQRPSFRSAIDLVLLNVSVTGPGGKYVADLTSDDFQIFEDGRPQELTFFAPSMFRCRSRCYSIPARVWTSKWPWPSRRQRNSWGACGRAMWPRLSTSTAPVEVLQPFTSDRQLLYSAIDRMRAGGSTALYNAVYVALRQLAKPQAQPSDDIVARSSLCSLTARTHRAL